jgi:hypothetical protein
METLPRNLRKLISEHQTAVREGLQKLRESSEPQVTIRGSKPGETVTIRPLKPIESGS